MAHSMAGLARQTVEEVMPLAQIKRLYRNALEWSHTARKYGMDESTRKYCEAQVASLEYVMAYMRYGSTKVVWR